MVERLKNHKVPKTQFKLENAHCNTGLRYEPVEGKRLAGDI